MSKVLELAPIPNGATEFQRKFISEIPPGTAVWKNVKKEHYGMTWAQAPGFDLGIYSDPLNPEVIVNSIDGQPDTWDRWKAREVVTKT